MTLRALADSLIVKQHREDDKSPGGIIIPNPQELAQGTVVAKGPDVEGIRLGQTVMYSPNAGQQFKHDGVMLTAIVDQDLFGVIDA